MATQVFVFVCDLFDEIQTGVFTVRIDVRSKDAALLRNTNLLHARAKLLEEYAWSPDAQPEDYILVGEYVLHGDHFEEEVVA